MIYCKKKKEFTVPSTSKPMASFSDIITTAFFSRVNSLADNKLFVAESHNILLSSLNFPYIPKLPSPNCWQFPYFLRAHRLCEMKGLY